MKLFIHLKFYLCFLLLSFLAIISCKEEVSTTADAENSLKQSVNISVANDRTTTVYYFHTTFRCYSCTKIEELTKQTLTNNFTKQLKSGRIEFKSVNVEENQNKHFIQDYQLFTKSVVLVDYANGKQMVWKRLDQTWSYLGDPDVFKKYIIDEITAFIKK